MSGLPSIGYDQPTKNLAEFFQFSALNEQYLKETP
jgi:hypothetical protein